MKMNEQNPQNEIMRLKAEIYDIQNQKEREVATLQQAIVEMASAAKFHPKEDGTFQLEEVMKHVCEKLALVPEPEVQEAAE